MNAMTPIGPAPAWRLTAAGRIDREAEHLDHLREAVATWTEERMRREIAIVDDAMAEGLAVIANYEGRTQQTLCWLLGHYALRSRVLNHALQERGQ